MQQGMPGMGAPPQPVPADDGFGDFGGGASADDGFGDFGGAAAPAPDLGMGAGMGMAGGMAPQQMQQGVPPPADFGGFSTAPPAAQADMSMGMPAQSAGGFGDFGGAAPAPEPAPAPPPAPAMGIGGLGALSADMFAEGPPAEAPAPATADDVLPKGAEVRKLVESAVPPV